MTDLQQLVRADRRRKRRYATAGLGALWGTRRLQVVDIGLMGIGIATRRSIPPNERLQLRVRSEVGEFTVTGRVAWSKFEGSFRNATGELEPRYRAGLRFDPLHPRDAQYLLDLLDRLAKREEKRRVSSPRLELPSSPAAAG